MYWKRNGYLLMKQRVGRDVSDLRSSSLNVLLAITGSANNFPRSFLIAKRLYIFLSTMTTWFYVA